MTNTALLILIGAFIGWNLPQPSWAKWVQAKFLALFGKIKAKFHRKPKLAPESDMKKSKVKTKKEKKQEVDTVKPVETPPVRKWPLRKPE